MVPLLIEDIYVDREIVASVFTQSPQVHYPVCRDHWVPIPGDDLLPQQLARKTHRCETRAGTCGLAALNNAPCAINLTTHNEKIWFNPCNQSTDRIHAENLNGEPCRLSCKNTADRRIKDSGLMRSRVSLCQYAIVLGEMGRKHTLFRMWGHGEIAVLLFEGVAWRISQCYNINLDVSVAVCLQSVSATAVAASGMKPKRTTMVHNAPHWLRCSPLSTVRLEFCCSVFIDTINLLLANSIDFARSIQDMPTHCVPLAKYRRGHWRGRSLKDDSVIYYRWELGCGQLTIAWQRPRLGLQLLTTFWWCLMWYGPLGAV